MIKTSSGRRSRVVVSQLWLLGAQIVNLLGWMIALLPPVAALWAAGILGTIQGASAIMLRQSTSEPMR